MITYVYREYLRTHSHMHAHVVLEQRNTISRDDSQQGAQTPPKMIPTNLGSYSFLSCLTLSSAVMHTEGLSNTFLIHVFFLNYSNPYDHLQISDLTWTASVNDLPAADTMNASKTFKHD